MTTLHCFQSRSGLDPDSISFVNSDSHDGQNNPLKEEKIKKYTGLKIGMFSLEARRLLLELEDPI
jgi:hypothetical protein